MYNKNMKNSQLKMIGFHTHTLFSDGELLPSEMVRRSEAKGYKAIALTDHVDSSNIDFVLPRIVKVCRVLNRHWKIRAIPGVEITHAPIQEIAPLVRFARKSGARIVVVHGETVSEPVLAGTNKAAIMAGCDVLAHPGLISAEDVKLAKKMGVFLELTTRKNHLSPNRRLVGLARATGAKLVLNTDAHDEDDIVTYHQAIRFLAALGMRNDEIAGVFRNSEELLKRLKI
ncbi:MAG: histidinol phosphate phosphatase domain-containing protein [Candidatus Omnitrophica bacterium]|nr:histidinol phosphate phosphatase domain-containing protein [Candidatus Omnitrophota bacterium]MCM8790157.1 histidinol phosphate phosphatase domain-containing protein [Candidatus Omnitrophota bacterium]